MYLKRQYGYLLFGAAAAGFIFGIVGLFVLWGNRPVVTQSVMDTLALFDQALNTTQDSLSIIGQVVQSTTDDVASLQTTTQALAQTIHDTNPMFDSLTTLASKDFPAAIEATQTSLKSAQSSAQLIDNVLTTLSSIPFLQVADYQPDVPLHTSLAEVSTSLNTLTPALAVINSSLADGKTSLAVVEVELTKIAETTTQISSALGGALTAIDDYKIVTNQLKMRVEGAQRVASGWITTITWILSFLLGWLLIAQLGLYAQGLEILQGRHEKNYPIEILHPAGVEESNPVSKNDAA